MNRNGHPETLVAAHPGNTNRLRHGFYSDGDRALTPAIERYREELLSLPHVAPVDAVAVDECARLLARIEAVDRDLDERGHFGNRGARSLLEHRARLSRELRAWLGALGALPSERAAWVARLTRRADVDARLRAIEGESASDESSARTTQESES